MVLTTEGIVNLVHYGLCVITYMKKKPWGGSFSHMYDVMWFYLRSAGEHLDSPCSRSPVAIHYGAMLHLL